MKDDKKSRKKYEKRFGKALAKLEDLLDDRTVPDYTNLVQDEQRALALLYLDVIALLDIAHTRFGLGDAMAVAGGLTGRRGAVLDAGPMSRLLTTFTLVLQDNVRAFPRDIRALAKEDGHKAWMSKQPAKQAGGVFAEPLRTPKEDAEALRAFIAADDGATEVYVPYEALRRVLAHCGVVLPPASNAEHEGSGDRPEEPDPYAGSDKP
jgi:hypothetical protein